MSIIIGLDTHVASCDFVAINAEGKECGAGRIKTNAQEIRSLFSGLKKGPKTLVLEQGPMAQWIRRVTGPRATVVVSECRRNRWVAKDSVKSDRIDAKKLALLYRGGFIKEVVPRDVAKEQLFRLTLQHHDLSQHIVSVKNQLKAKYRQNGVKTTGTCVYGTQSRDRFLEQLDSNLALKYGAELIYEQIDLLEKQKKQVGKHIERVASKYPIINRLIKKFPGIGIIRASTFVALIDCPERFSTVKKLWTYCGLGLDIRSSGKGRPRVTLTYRGNRLLKYTIKSATLSAITRTKNNRYRESFEEKIQIGRERHKVILTTARKLAKDMWLTWIEHNKLNDK